MEKKKQELKECYELIALEFAGKVREETTKAGLGEIPKALIEYLFKRLNPILEEVADKITYKAESWLKSRRRKIGMWLRDKF